MPTASSLGRPAARFRRRWLASLVLTAMIGFAATSTWSQQPEATKPGRAAAAESGDQWRDLLPGQQQFLQPLERDWAGLDPQQRRKWRLLSNRAPKMSDDERQRIQARMTEWATLTSEQRGQARLRYQEARQLPAHDRQARWDSYQSLPAEQKQQLAARAALPPEGARKAAPGNAHADRPGHEPQPVAKSNIVPNPALAARPKPIGPTLLQARPGASTTLMSKPATPPAHQQTGMPKIAATPEFVNRATLLPQRGPQAAASTRSTPTQNHTQTPTPTPTPHATPTRGMAAPAASSAEAVTRP